MANKRNSPLGKGLNALLPLSITESSEGEGASEKSHKDSPFFYCPVDFIAPNPYQPRTDMETSALANLAASIKEKGVLQPLVIRQGGAKQYELIAGERRLRAAKMAGLEKVPVLVRDVADSDRLELALIENIQRENLNPVEEAIAYEKLMEEFGLTQESVAKRVGKNRSTVANSVRILQLPDDVKQDLAVGKISLGHARVLLGLGDNELIRSFRDEIINNKLSVRETEAMVKKAKKKQANASQNIKKVVRHGIADSYCLSLTNSLVNYLGSKIKINQSGQRGKIEIEYYSPDDLERVLALIVKE